MLEHAGALTEAHADRFGSFLKQITFANRNLRYRFSCPMVDRKLTSHDLQPMDRRKFVALLGMSGAAMFLAPNFGDKLSWLGGQSASPANPFNLPEEWVHVLGEPLKGYSSFLAGLQLKNISLQQIIEPHMKMRSEVRCGIPPATLWKSMRPTLLVADQIAERLNEKVETVISAYRSPAYNARCPGAKSGSQHMANKALDLQFSSSPRKVARVAHELRAEGKFSGGIGLYPDFTHVDTRGTNTDWG
jgi:hypothetical protein